jgi:hypothetical protein
LYLKKAPITYLLPTMQAAIICSASGLSAVPTIPSPPILPTALVGAASISPTVPTTLLHPTPQTIEPAVFTSPPAPTATSSPQITLTTNEVLVLGST